MSCKNSPGSFKGAYRDRKTGSLFGVSGPLPCNCWKCEDCSPGKVKVLRKRMIKGLGSKVDPSDPYSVKFATLTCPGREFRETYTPSEAYTMMSVALNRMMILLQREYGDFDYFRVVELHKDGFPHFHVLMVGKNISPKGIRQRMAKLWQENYGLGFIGLNVVKNVKHGINYLTKYLTKGLMSVRKYARVFSSSRYALAKFERPKPDWLETRFYVGRAIPAGVVEIPIKNPSDFKTIRRLVYQLVAPPFTQVRR